MFSACITCYTPFTTLRALKRHNRRYHPNTREEQIMCKVCNLPFSNQYNLNQHNTKFHNGNQSTTASPSKETDQNSDSEKHETIINDYTSNLIFLEINQRRNSDFIRRNTMNLFQILEITKELARRIEAIKEYQTVELNSKTYDCQICNKLFKNSNSLSTHKSRFHPKSYGEANVRKIEDSPYYQPSL